MLYAVLVEILAVLISRDKVLLVVIAASHRVRFLYAASRRSVVTCYGETYYGTVRETYLLLHQSLTEGASAYYHRPVIILHSTSEYLAGRC